MNEEKTIQEQIEQLKATLANRDAFYNSAGTLPAVQKEKEAKPFGKATTAFPDKLRR